MVRGAAMLVDIRRVPEHPTTVRLALQRRWPTSRPSYRLANADYRIEIPAGEDFFWHGLTLQPTASGSMEPAPRKPACTSRQLFMTATEIDRPETRVHFVRAP